MHKKDKRTKTGAEWFRWYVSSPNKGCSKFN